MALQDSGYNCLHRAPEGISQGGGGGAAKLPSEPKAAAHTGWVALACVDLCVCLEVPTTVRPGLHDKKKAWKMVGEM